LNLLLTFAHRYFRQLSAVDKEDTSNNWIPSDGESTGCSPPENESPLNKILMHDRPSSSASGINGGYHNYTIRGGMSSHNGIPHQSSFDRQQQGKRHQVPPQGIPIPKPRFSNNSPPQLSGSPNFRREGGSPVNQSWGPFVSSSGIQAGVQFMCN